LKLFQRNTELAKNLEKERRADFPAAMKRNRNSATVWVVPPFVTAGLTSAREA
jgi:hypothetical protein